MKLDDVLVAQWSNSLQVLMHQSVINEGGAVQVESGKPPARHSHCTGLFKGICLVCI